MTLGEFASSTFEDTLKKLRHPKMLKTLKNHYLVSKYSNNWFGRKLLLVHLFNKTNDQTVRKVCGVGAGITNNLYLEYHDWAYLKILYHYWYLEGTLSAITPKTFIF